MSGESVDITRTILYRHDSVQTRNKVGLVSQLIIHNFLKH